MPKNSTRLLAAAALALSLSLSACSGTPEPTDSATPSASEPATPSATPSPTPSVSVNVVNNLDGITVTGAAGVAPTLAVPAPMAISETMSKVLIPGSGNVVSGTSFVDVNYVGVNGRTGDKFDSSWDRGASITFPLDSVVPGFKKGLEGKKVGDRVLIAMTGEDGYDAGGGNPQANIAVGDTLVFVVDIVETSVTAATGSQGTPPAGAPAVAGTDGKPVVTVPDGAAVPTETAVHPLIVGSGRKVGEKDFVLVLYRSWSWKTGKQLDDKYATPESGNISETIQAWKTGIVGQPIGSRVMIVASPADSYPEGSTNPPLEKGDAIVYVVDVLYASPDRFQ